MSIDLETYSIKPTAWLRPGIYCGGAIGIFVLILAGFSGELFDADAIRDVLTIACSLTVGFGLGMFLILWLNGLKLKVTVSSNGISSFDFFSSPCSLSWEKMKSITTTKVIGFPYYVIRNEEGEEVWIPAKLNRLQDLFSTIEQTLGTDSEIVQDLKRG